MNLGIFAEGRTFMSKLNTYKGRLAELALGHTAMCLMGAFWNFMVYPFVIYKFGIIKGGVIMTFVSFADCLLTMKFYDWSKRDWLGIEAIKGVKGYDGSHKAGRFASWVLKKGDPVVFVVLSLRYDPFFTTAYLRHGVNQYNGMSRRDWRIFMGSLILSNAYWTLAVFMGISLVEWGWKTIKGLGGI